VFSRASDPLGTLQRSQTRGRIPTESGKSRNFKFVICRPGSSEKWPWSMKTVEKCWKDNSTVLNFLHENYCTWGRGILHMTLKSWQELSSCWNGRPFGHNRHGPKIGGAWSLANTMWPGPRPTSVPSAWGLMSVTCVTLYFSLGEFDVIGRTLPFCHWSYILYDRLTVMLYIDNLWMQISIFKIKHWLSWHTLKLMGYIYKVVVPL